MDNRRVRPLFHNYFDDQRQKEQQQQQQQQPLTAPSAQPQQRGSHPTTAATAVSPLELVNKWVGARISVLMRNDVEFIGTLKGFDDYVNLILEDTIELKSPSNNSEHAGTGGGYIKIGSMLLNGSNVVCLLQAKE